jgi:hypothetical protein
MMYSKICGLEVCNSTTGISFSFYFVYNFLNTNFFFIFLFVFLSFQRKVEKSPYLI